MSVLPLEPRGPWRFSQLEELPSDGRRFEVVDGNLVVTPPPTQFHQFVAQRLARQLNLEALDEWDVYTDFGLPLGDDGRVPDLAVVRSDVPISSDSRNPLTAQHFGLVGEVVSPSTRKTDRFAKPGEYAEAGIPIYWRIEVEPVVQIHGFRLVDGGYVEVTGALPTPWGEFIPDLEQLGIS